ncbi:hypothetical protein BKA67DRAFT_32844 [Truncatella angustata]|uniref:BZIP domain-containing protein n=1 Tax=Truncatella angustata TaxID=152316 RepID=A0A9P8UX19_9PEZI|nr:uncharacterized protein BKA67DRAFT_32844 [Truncatella angustata]KAH6659922.1 hypothetical protein BKA67DRAFT_32844 [Truncatella angustata]
MTAVRESSHNEDADSAKVRAQARRAQVRKAQKQHRQRKANYTKELEMDIARLRDMIEQTETDATAIRSENNVMRRQLSRNAVASGMMNLSVPVPRRSAPPVTGPMPDPLPPDPAPKAEPKAGGDEPEFVLRMDMDDTMQTPSFRVTRSPSPSFGTRGAGMFSPDTSSAGFFSPGTSTADIFSPSTSSAAVFSPGVSDFGMTATMALAATNPPSDFGASPAPVSSGLSEEQTELVINFILSLEHICWNHFGPSHYRHIEYDPMDPENGHALMASSIALQHANPEIFTRIDAVNSVIKSNPHCNPDTHDIEWQSVGLSLETLYGLAMTLNPPDKELAPVQAWFEIVQMYGPDVALDRQIIDGLTRGFRGMVRCLQFGAVIQREVFDNIVSNVVRSRFEGVALGSSIGTGMSLGPVIEDDERVEEVT